MHLALGVKAGKSDGSQLLLFCRDLAIKGENAHIGMMEQFVPAIDHVHLMP